MREHISPEEKLLSLIKGKSVKSEAGALVSKAPNSQIAVSRKLQKPGASFKDSLRSFEQVFFSVVGMRMVLWGLFSLSCLYLIFTLMYPLLELRHITLPKAEIRSSGNAFDPVRGDVKPLEYYSEGLKGSQIFGGGAQRATGATALGSAELIKDLTLMGIISGDNPQAVIEDKKSLKSSTLSKGQFIGEFQIEDIAEGKVILNLRGQRFELYM